MIPALLKWIGNKQRFAEQIVGLMPKEFNNYYEPFLGSGAVMAQALTDRNAGLIQFKDAYCSDILPFLIDVFNITKNDPQSLIKYYSDEISLYYKDSDRYEIIRERFNKNHNPYDFCLLSRTCYSGIIRFRKNDGYMSTPRGPHKPISPETFEKRVNLWSNLIENVNFSCESFSNLMDSPGENDVVYCDPPYTHSQSIIYGAQNFDINDLWDKIEGCKNRGAHVLLSINGMRESQRKDISLEIPKGLFKRQFFVDCGISMIDRLQHNGKKMDNEEVHDKLLLTW